MALGVIGYRGLTKPVTAPPGSPLAARLLAAQYVGQSQGADPVRVNEEPVIQAGTATVKTVFGTNQECTVKLVRSHDETRYGWLVERVACGQAN
ncbi:hypothetical protein GTP90_02070 [Rugamonas sp. FT81W]|uniref:Uncharacterized protein n=1 Tax=Duganella vulcania TaxID=2692166 RepID=A0A845GDE5_9BURK|nr:hypothetical protein [Duganella vulcania]